jgi:hypothetical protein
LTLSTPVEAPEADRRADAHQPQLVSLSWALRRAALLLALVAVMVVVGVWLFYASIDADDASAAGASPTSVSATPR